MKQNKNVSVTVLIKTPEDQQPALQSHQLLDERDWDTKLFIIYYLRNRLW